MLLVQKRYHRLYKKVPSFIKQHQSKEFIKLIARFFKILRLSLIISYKKTIEVFKVIFLRQSFIRTFLFAYLYEIIPKIFKRLFKFKKFNSDQLANDLGKILTDPFSDSRFPIFMAKLVAVMNAFTPIFNQILSKYNNQLDIPFWSTFSSAMVASLFTFPVFQEEKIKIDRHYTLDWTLILITRALDTIVSSSFSDSSFIPNILKSSSGDIIMFIISCFLIMVTWTFNPEKLDPGYLNWINKASMIDREVVDGIRYMKDGSLNYKSDNLANSDHFKNYCISKNQDPELGDLSIRSKLSCEVLHQFRSKSCVKHVLWRFMNEFKFAFKLYSSLNLFTFVFIKRFKDKPIKLLMKTIRSSAFLASITSLYWCGYCFTRNKHPRYNDQLFWDLLAPYVGSFLSGFSILIEKADRRNELSLFLVPKALGTFVDSTPTDRNLKIEIIAFSLSFATLIAYARSSPTKLRGLVGRGLSYMIQ